KEVFKGPDGSVGFNRAIGLAKDGSIYFNGPSDADARFKKAEQKLTEAAAKVAVAEETKAQARARAAEKKKRLAAAKTESSRKQRTPLMKYDAASGKLVPTKAFFVGSSGLRCLTPQLADGSFYGVTQNTYELFRYSPKEDKITLLGPSWMKGT